MGMAESESRWGAFGRENLAWPRGAATLCSDGSVRGDVPRGGATGQQRMVKLRPMECLVFRGYGIREAGDYPPIPMCRRFRGFAAAQAGWPWSMVTVQGWSSRCPNPPAHGEDIPPFPVMPHCAQVWCPPWPRTPGSSMRGGVLWAGSLLRLFLANAGAGAGLLERGARRKEARFRRRFWLVWLVGLAVHAMMQTPLAVLPPGWEGGRQAVEVLRSELVHCPPPAQPRAREKNTPPS
jgi:hypothetical protein